MTMQKFKTYQLAINFYRNSKKLSLREPLRNQFHRASLSIVLNLAEGSAKPTAKDRRKFYRIGLESLREVQAILDIIGHTQLFRCLLVQIMSKHLNLFNFELVLNNKVTMLKKLAIFVNTQIGKRL